MNALATTLEQRRQQLESLRVQAKTFRGACSKCRWRKTTEYGGDLCAYPALQETVLDPVLGVRTLASGVRCSAARAPDGVCGADGELFEPRTLLQHAWFWAKVLMAVAVAFVIVASVIAAGSA